MRNESSTPMLGLAIRHHGVSAPMHTKTEAGTTPVLPFTSINGYSALPECVKSRRPSHSTLEFRRSFQHISPTELPLPH
jgi:hypothetical protein